MHNLPRFLCKQLAHFLPARSLFAAKTPVFMPFYHAVSNVPLPHVLNYPVFSEKVFEEQLDYLLKYFKPLALDEIHLAHANRKPGFHLSFDDGLRENIEIIAPLLLKKGIPASFFVNSAFVDNKALFHRYKASLILRELKSFPNNQAENLMRESNISEKNILKTPYQKREVLDEMAEQLEIDFATFLEMQQPYLNTEQVLQLKKQGFSIGAHSHKHPEFWLLSEKKQFKQVKRSMDWLQENIQPKIKAFAFPFTDHGVSAQLIRRLRTENICDISFGTAGVKYDEVSSHFQRYPVEQEGNFAANLKGEFLYYKLRQSIGKATVKH